MGGKWRRRLTKEKAMEIVIEGGREIGVGIRVGEANEGSSALRLSRRRVFEWRSKLTSHRSRRRIGRELTNEG